VVTGTALVSAVLGMPTSSAAEPVPARAVGYDVSHPQCGDSLPADAAFAVVGVNGGVATTGNPCLAEQWQWASGASGADPDQPRAQLYVNTANPGEVRDQVTTWPRSGSNRYGLCDGDNSAACSYEYGVARAEDDVQLVLDTLGELPPWTTGAGTATPADLDGLAWWLDVETMNTWQTDGAQARRNNRATLEGMAEHLQSVGGRVGLYSTGYQWGRIVGTVPASSSLYELDSWLAGARSARGAAANCSDDPLVDGGQVVLTQYVVDDLDHNWVCESDADRTPGAAG